MENKVLFPRSLAISLFPAMGHVQKPLGSGQFVYKLYAKVCRYFRQYFVPNFMKISPHIK